MPRKVVRLRVADVRREAEKHGGRVQKDGCGGYEVLAPAGRRWVDAEVQCMVLPISEYRDARELQDELRICIDMMSHGHEALEDEDFDPAAVDRILDRIILEENNHI